MRVWGGGGEGEVAGIDRIAEARIAGHQSDAGSGDAGADQKEAGIEKEPKQAEGGAHEPEGRDRSTERARVEGPPEIPNPRAHAALLPPPACAAAPARRRDRSPRAPRAASGSA